MSLVVVKLGGSAITNKEGRFSIRKKVIDQLGEELASVDEDLVLIHGGGSFGHPVASEYDINSGYKREEQLMGISKTHQAMEKLNSRIVESLLDAGRPAMAVQTSACTIVEDDEIVDMELRNIEKLVDLGVVPVLYGDSVPDLEKGMTILSGDQLLAYMAERMGASEVILGTDTDGIYTSDPKISINADLIPRINADNWDRLSKLVNFSSPKDVTGGMRNKVEVLIDLAKKGIDSQVVNATEPKNIQLAIGTNKRIGTKITGG